MDLQKRLDAIEVFRNQSYITYKLLDVLTIVMSCVICGFDFLEDLAVFAKERVSFLKDMFMVDKIHSKIKFIVNRKIQFFVKIFSCKNS